MKRFLTYLPCVLFSVLLVACVAMAQSASTPNLTANVNPIFGTGSGPGGGINMFPGATTPFGMVQLSPDTGSSGFGYSYRADYIQGFSMTHMSGPGCPNEGDVFFTATTGPIHTTPEPYSAHGYASPFSHQFESATPGYYQVRLLEWDINAQLSATDRTGIAQFTFPAGQPANILLPISHTLDQTHSASVQVVGDNQFQGYVEDNVFCGTQGTYKVYYTMTFSRPFSSFGTWTGQRSNRIPGPETVDAGSRSAEQTTRQQNIGAYATWPAEAQQQTITAKIAISYVDPAGAENNMKAESAGKDFSAIRSDANAAWNKALGAIDVSGGTSAERTVFYTALYHSLLMPSIFNDADGRYLGFDDKIHQVASGHAIYANWSGWDIYRSQTPLLALIDPDRMEDMAQSVVLMYQQGGWIDRWPQFNHYTNTMGGSPLTVILANAWLDGLHGFDMNAGWEGMLKDATQAPPPGKPYGGELGIDWINNLHYIPYDKEVRDGPVSRLQEDAIAYASLYRLAVALGKTADAKNLYDRALYYRNVFDHEDRFFRPRDADAQWTPNFDPEAWTHAFIEGSGWQYQWMEPADMAWVVNAVGRDLFNQRLSEFFNYPAPSQYGRYYNPYDETDLEAPFEFNFSGEPWESQRVVRRLLNENYTPGPSGTPGNDDCGAMSSWAVMSMLGIYTVDPASLAYELVGPVFPKAVIHLHQPYAGKTFTIEASGASPAAAYIQSVDLNGRPHPQNWISFHDIAAGATLHFTLGTKPNKSWGAKPSDAPPSLSDTQP